MRCSQSDLAVEVRSEGATTEVRVHGELDITSSPLLLAVIDQVLAPRQRPQCLSLMVNMSGVGFADASGIAPLLLARAVLTRRGGSIELRHCRRSVLRLLRLLGVSDLADPIRPPAHGLEARPTA